MSTQRFFARCGRRRGFMSQTDAQAYEVGYMARQNGREAPAYDGPEMSGWRDADAEIETTQRGECEDGR